MTTLTINEHQYLDAICSSEYNIFNGRPETQDAIMELVDGQIWSFGLGGFGKSAGGIASSLVKKGLVEVFAIAGASADDTIWLTKKGAEVLIAANAEFGPACSREEAKPVKKGTHPKHPKCGSCDKAVYKSDTVGKAVKKSDPWGYCRNTKCRANGRYMPVVGSNDFTSVPA